jgi:hypothetical protein
MDWMTKLLRYNTIADLNYHIGLIFENDESFIRHFISKKENKYDITRVSFSNEYMCVDYWDMDTGQHYTNSFKLAEFNVWVKEVDIRYVDYAREYIPITADLVKKLREITEETMMNCKKALTACNGNIVEAEKYLKENKHRGCVSISYDRSK